MPIVYSVNVLEKLKQRGYSTTILRQKNILSESVIQKLRTGEPVSMETLEKLCVLLRMEVGDIIAYKPKITKQSQFEESIVKPLSDLISNGEKLGLVNEEIFEITINLLKAFIDSQ